MPDYVVKSGINYRPVADQIGSVRLVVRADTGAIAQAISYDEFGRVLSDTNPGFQAFGFAGGLYDHQTSLVRFGARDYDPETGRWLSKDPILFGGGDTNLYGYVLNDPINLVDPDGRIAIEVGGSFLGQFSTFGLGGSKNFAVSLDLRTGNWQAGTTSSFQANVGGGLYGGVGGSFSITPGLSASVCDLAGGAFGVGGAAGVGATGASGQVTYGNAGPTFSGSIQYTGLGAGVAGYGAYSHTNVNIIRHGNLYQSVRSWFGK